LGIAEQRGDDAESMPVRKHPLQRSCRFQPLTDDVARRPLSNRWLPLVMTQLVLRERRPRKDRAAPQD
jgi:hypothetical protein